MTGGSRRPRGAHPVEEQRFDRRRAAAQSCGWLAAAAALAAVLEWLPKPAHTVLWDAVYDAGHAPLFGTGALIALRLSLVWLRRRLPDRAWHYAVAFAATVGAGAAAELHQHWLPGRDADPVDLLRDAIGAAAFLAVAATADRRLRAERPAVARRRAWVWAAAALALAGTATPVGAVALAYRAHARALPRLIGFDRWWDRWFVAAHHGATAHLAAPPPDWPDARGGALAVDFGAGHGPRVDIVDVPADWRGYRRLVVSLYANSAEPVRVAVRLRDRFPSEGDADAAQYDAWFDVGPGPDRAVVDLAAAHAGARPRPLDVAAIRSVTLVMPGQSHPVRLFIDELRLE